ncbi:DNA/RNA non-specific endonuclease [Flavobacterium caeni]|nr:DNA/RNA non-specific endonuclease [Flavobacterium caeni]
MKRIVFFATTVLCFGCQHREAVDAQPQQLASEAKSSPNDWLPSSTTRQIVVREGYVFSYHEKYEQAEWVAYELKASDLKGANFDRPFFIQDPKVKTGSADWRNYKKSGYDKGHLCPAGDRKRSKKTFDETFYTSNIAPQRHDFNEGVWNRLEQKTRYWAQKNGKLQIVTGGVLREGLRTIGKEHVAVPEYFYKIIRNDTGGKTKMIGFLVPHQKSNRPLYEFVVPIDVIEQKTGIDFFPVLPDAVENRLERNADYKDWSF